MLSFLVYLLLQAAAAAGAVLADLFVALATGLLFGTILAPAPAALLAVLLLVASAAANGSGITSRGSAASG